MNELAIPPVARSWERIDNWLAVHAPLSLAFLAPPAADLDLRSAQRVIGVEFPAELVESLRCHDGLREWSNLLPEQPPSSSLRIAEHWRMCMEIAPDVDGFTVHPLQAEPWWNPLWVPWAEGDGDARVIDLRPGPTHGRLGMAYHDGSGDFSDGWPDLATYLHEVAQALYAGGEIRGWYPYLTVDGELWWDRRPDIRTVNDEPLVRAPGGITRGSG
jgi:cell wall assembly regulator SMI1